MTRTAPSHITLHRSYENRRALAGPRNTGKERPLKKLLSVRVLMVLTTIVSLALLLGASWKWRPF